MNLKKIYLFALVVALTQSVAWAGEKQKSIRIGSGASKEGYHRVAQVLKTTKIKKDGKLRRIMTVSTGGSITNIKALKSGEFSLALSQENIAREAYTGTGLFADYGSVASLRSIARLYPEYLFIIARSGSKINKIEDLKGKHIGLGSAGSGTLETSMRLLGDLGIQDKDLHAHFGRIRQIIDDFKKDKVEAFFYISSFPSPLLEELNKETPIKVLSIQGNHLTGFLKGNPGFSSTTLKKPYSSLSDVETISIDAMLFTREEMPDQEIYSLTKNLWEKAPKFKLPLDKTLALNTLNVPLHPGAAKYYREIKILRK